MASRTTHKTHKRVPGTRKRTSVGRKTTRLHNKEPKFIELPLSRGPGATPLFPGPGAPPAPPVPAVAPAPPGPVVVGIEVVARWEQAATARLAQWEQVAEQERVRAQQAAAQQRSEWDRERTEWQRLAEQERDRSRQAAAQQLDAWVQAGERDRVAWRREAAVAPAAMAIPGPPGPRRPPPPPPPPPPPTPRRELTAEEVQAEAAAKAKAAAEEKWRAEYNKELLEKVTRPTLKKVPPEERPAALRARTRTTKRRHKSITLPLRTRRGIYT